MFSLLSFQFCLWMDTIHNSTGKKLAPRCNLGINLLKSHWVMFYVAILADISYNTERRTQWITPQCSVSSAWHPFEQLASPFANVVNYLMLLSCFSHIASRKKIFSEIGNRIIKPKIQLKSTQLSLIWNLIILKTCDISLKVPCKNTQFLLLEQKLLRSYQDHSYTGNEDVDRYSPGNWKGN